MNREDMIKEARTIEATKNGYMGLEGAFSVIARRLGQPIFHQGGLNYQQNFLDDPYDFPEEDDIPMMEEDAFSYEVGYQFDGLSRGINMSIVVYHHLREITCRFSGQIVYKETSGELEGYAPSPEWEDKIQSLLKIARDIEQQQRPFERREMVKAADKKRTEILDYLKKKWGL